VGVGIAGVRHIKLPVTDLERSVVWYRELLDLELWMEFVEGSELRGASLMDTDAGFMIALRLREHCASRPDLAGFDPVAFNLRSREILDVLVERAERLGTQHSGVREQGNFGASLDVLDPDSTHIRFIWVGPEHPTGFVGTVFGEDGRMSFYDTPRLTPG